MSEPVIKVENLGKRYFIGHQRSKDEGLRHVIEEAIRAPLKWFGARRRQRKQELEEFWALSDVSFEVQKGDVVGIIGRNGAGKSTLLKILSRITEPTKGRIQIDGRVASLLEVGTGFHPELTGRENIFLNGAILGMTRVEIKSKFDEIVAFSEVEKFLDTPVKKYSSGMYVRLAFAVAAHLDPDILIIDEVLAVGDAQFQKKCLGKMQDVSVKDGRSVLFVSHNLPAVRTLCTKGLLLTQGKAEYFDSTEHALDAYADGVSAGKVEQVWVDSKSAPGDHILRLLGIRAVSADEGSTYLAIEDDFTIEIDYEVLQFHPCVCVSIHLYTQNVCAFVGGNESTAHPVGRFRAAVKIPGYLLNTGIYSVTVFLITDVTQYRVLLRDVISFQMEEREARGEFTGHIVGAVRPRLNWKVSRLDTEFGFERHMNGTIESPEALALQASGPKKSRSGI